MKPNIFAWCAAAVLALAVGCGGVAEDSDTAAAQEQTVSSQGQTCKSGQQLCPTCDGTGTYCALRCYECPPLRTQGTDTTVSATAGSCPAHQFLCQRCDGTYFCAPECAPCFQ